MYLKRTAEQPLKDILAGDKVGILLGARQVGKTTLVEHVLAGQSAVFLDFDIEVDKSRFLAAAALSPAEALRSLGSPVVLVVDEAQRLPEAAPSSRAGTTRGCRSRCFCSVLPRWICSTRCPRV